MAFDTAGGNAECGELGVGDARKIDMVALPKLRGALSEWMIGLAVGCTALTEGGPDTDERFPWVDVPFSLENGEERLNGGLLAPIPNPSPLRGRGEQTPPSHMQETDHLSLWGIHEDGLAVRCTNGQEHLRLVSDKAIGLLSSSRRLMDDNRAIAVDLPEGRNIRRAELFGDISIGVDMIFFRQKHSIDAVVMGFKEPERMVEHDGILACRPSILLLLSTLAPLP